MSLTEHEQPHLKFLLDRMDAAIDLMAEFPSHAAQEASASGDVPHDPEGLDRFLRSLIDTWPPGTFDVFVELSLVLSDCIFTATERLSLREREALQLFTRYKHLSGQEDADLAYDVLYAKTVTTLLGPRVFNWLLTPGQEGLCKLQPHEMSRANWYLLWQMRHQIGLEHELRRMGAFDPQQSKLVSAAAWTMAALAAHMHQSVFVSEGEGHLSAVTAGSLTVSLGRGTETIAALWPSSMQRVIKVLREAVVSETVDACDMMWVAAGMARVMAHSAGRSEPETDAYEYLLFLSHRGSDVKKELTQSILQLGVPPEVFLDCVSLPRGLVNRHFVFRSLARSGVVLVVDSPHFNESAWCRKEAWLAEALARHDQVKLIRVAGYERAIPYIELAAKIDEPTAPDDGTREVALAQEGFENDDEGRDTPWVCNRILRDIDYWARTPNLYSAKEKGLPVDFFEPMLNWLRAECERPTADTDALRTSLLAHVDPLFSDLAAVINRLESTPRQDGLYAASDLCAAAAQLTVAALSLRTRAYSKMETRRRIVALNRVIVRIIQQAQNTPDPGTEKLLNYFLLAAGATTLDLAGEDRFELPRLGLNQLVSGVAICRDGLLLLDVRKPGPGRDSILKLVLLMVTHDLGSVGVLQDGAAPVHHTVIDGASLEVLPCVTLYEGMESLFPEVISQ